MWYYAFSCTKHPVSWSNDSSFVHLIHLVSVRSAWFYETVSAWVRNQTRGVSHLGSYVGLKCDSGIIYWIYSTLNFFLSYLANTWILIGWVNIQSESSSFYSFLFGPVGGDAWYLFPIYSVIRRYTQTWFQSYLQGRSYHVAWRHAISSLLPGFPGAQFWTRSCSYTLNYWMRAEISGLLPLQCQWHTSSFLFFLHLATPQVFGRYFLFLNPLPNA